VTSRTENEDALGEALAWARHGVSIAVATVIATWGSSPRPVGSKMVVNAAGEMRGSVSGGCVESAVVQAALDVIRSGKPALLEFGVSDDEAWNVGLACGGRIRVYVEPLT
jgi:xanthine/CO dehydrogenase XdhC/CoxF family maturation factor